MKVNGGPLGVGKFVREVGDEVEIEYVDSISPTGRHLTREDRQRVEPVLLGLQRRCCWEHNGSWHVGRVVWQGRGEYGLRLPDSEIDSRIREADLYTRWNRPIEDPIDVLVAHGNESPFFRCHRCSAVDVDVA